MLPPLGVLERVGVNGLIGSAVHAPVGLIIASEIDSIDRDRPGHRVLPDRGRDRAASNADRADLSDVDGLDMHVHLDAVTRLGLTWTADVRTRAPAHIKRT